MKFYIMVDDEMMMMMIAFLKLLLILFFPSFEFFILYTFFISILN